MTITHLQPYREKRNLTSYSTPSPEDQLGGGGGGDDNRSMDQITRPELDSKLENVQLRIDAKLKDVVDRLSGVEAGFSSQRSLILSVAGAIIVTVIGTAVAVASLGFSAFDSGRETSKMISEAEKRMDTVVSKAVADIQAATHTTQSPALAPAKPPPSDTPSSSPPTAPN